MDGNRECNEDYTVKCRRTRRTCALLYQVDPYNQADLEGINMTHGVQGYADAIKSHYRSEPILLTIAALTLTVVLATAIAFTSPFKVASNILLEPAIIQTYG